MSRTHLKDCKDSYMVTVVVIDDVIKKDPGQGFFERVHLMM